MRLWVGVLLLLAGAWQFIITTPPAPILTSLSVTSGGVGATVVLTGLHFGSSQGSGTVVFASAMLATPTAWNDISITVTVPVGAITGPVVVVQNGVTSNPLTFTVSTGPQYFVDFTAGLDTNAGTAKATAWKHAPGMTGCTSLCSGTTIADSSSVIFKGGTTWTSSYPWTFTGGSSSMITYTTDHTWFTGGSYSQPIFDDQGAHPGGTGMANKSGGGFVTLNDLNFVNCGVAYTSVAGSPGANSDKCLVFSHTHDITITNSTFATESWIGIYFLFDAAGSFSNFTLTGNDFSHVNGAVWFASAQANTTMHNLYYVNNTFHDFHSQIGNGLHSDGALHHFNVPTGDATQYLDNVTFCNNKFFGDFTIINGANGFTAMFFSENALGGLICNNDVSFSPALPNNQGEAIWDVGTNGNSHPVTLNIVNNTASLTGSNATAISDCISEYDLAHTTITLENNICNAMQYVVGGGGTVTGTWDYNLWNTSGGQVSNSQTYAQWQTAGRDPHGVLGSDPVYVSSPGNQHLQTTSPARGAALNLTSLGSALLDSDRDGVARPASAPWDIGAYQYVGGMLLLARKD